MEFLRGQLGNKLIADLIREIAELKLSGLLRLTHEKTIKAIFFGSGAPVFAISNLHTEQIDYKLIKSRLAAAGLVEAAKKKAENPQKLGRTLVQTGVVTEQVLQQAAGELANQIIISLFEWKQADYVFSEVPQSELDAKLTWSAADCIVSGIRQAARLESIANAIAPGDKIIARAGLKENSIGLTATLTPAEGFVLSSISGPTAAGEVSTITGLSDADCRIAVCVLLALGLATAVEKVRDAVPILRVEEQPVAVFVTPPDLPAPAAQDGDVTVHFGPLDTTLPSSPLPAAASGPLTASLLSDPLLAALPSGPLVAVSPSGPLTSTMPSYSSPSSPAAAVRAFSPQPEDAPVAGPEWLSAPVVAEPEWSPPPASVAEPEWSPPPASVAEPEWSPPPVAVAASGPLTAVNKASGRYSQVTVEWVIELAARKITSMSTTNYYEVLGIEKFATMGTIKKAYDDLSEMFNSFRTRWPEHVELNTTLDTLFGQVDKAYATLTDPNKRRVYDMPATLPKMPKPMIERGGSEGTSSRRPSVPASGRSANIDVDATPGAYTTGLKRPGVLNPELAAEEHYRRGRAHYDRKDFHSAAHLFREAVGLDPAQGHYHYYLGITLAVLSQARKTHSHDEGCHVTCKIGGSLVRNQVVRREAEQHLLKAADLDRKNADIRLRLALLYKDAGMEKKAEQFFNETLLLDVGNAIALRELGLDGGEVE